MNDVFGVPEVYGDIVLDIEERLTALNIYTKYFMFTHSHLVEILCCDEESFNCAMAHFKLYEKEFSCLKMAVGIENELKILVLFEDE